MYVSLQGGYGGTDSSNNPFVVGGAPVAIEATVIPNPGGFATPFTQLVVTVGGGGGTATTTAPGAGGFGGGGPGGTGSNVPRDSLHGGGGGGATTASPNDGRFLLVAGGGGGAGGSLTGASQGPLPGGSGGSGGRPISTEGETQGVSQGQSGETPPGENPGGGGDGGINPLFPGTPGGDAEAFSSNAGGGGGGGLGGQGGQAGQGGLIGTAGAGGGGGSGASAADPTYTANASISFAQSDPADGSGLAVIKWVDILTTQLAPLRARRSTSQQLLAIFGGQPSTNLIWQISAGTLPVGLTLSSSGRLSGQPKQAGSYAFQVTVTNNLATSVTTYSGTVCSRRCWLGGRG